MDRDILHQYKMPVSDFNMLISFSTVTLLRDHYIHLCVFLLYCFMCICSHGNNHYNNLCLNTRVCGKLINTSLAILAHNELMILHSGNNLFLCLWKNPMQFIIAIYVNVILIHWPGMNITRLVSHALSIKGGSKKRTANVDQI